MAFVTSRSDPDHRTRLSWRHGLATGRDQTLRDAYGDRGRRRGLGAAGTIDPDPRGAVQHRHEKPHDTAVSDGLETITLGLGWGAERVLLELDGVWTTAVGHVSWTPTPRMRRSAPARPGTRGSPGGVRPAGAARGEAAATFFEWHDPTQGMRQRQGNLYRSAILASTPAVGDGPPDRGPVRRGTRRRRFRPGDYRDRTAGGGALGEFYFAEDHHQQYLVKNPGGYDCHVRSGVACPI